MALSPRQPASIVTAIAQPILLGWSMYALAVLWWPGYWAWGLVGVGLTGVWAIWTLRGIVAADRKVSGNPIYLALPVPLAVLLWHLLGGDVGPVDSSASSAGGIVASVVFQVALLGLALMLSQSLLSGWASRWWLLAAVGAAMVIGPGTALLDTTFAPAHPALAAMVTAGAALLAGAAARWLARGHLPGLAGGGGLLVLAGVAVGGAIQVQPGIAAPLLVCTGLAIAAAAGAKRWAWLAAGAALVIGGVILAFDVSGGADGTASWHRLSLLGVGDFAIGDAWGGSSGWEILLAMTGIVGLAGGAAGVVFAMLVLSRRWSAGGADRIGGACWLARALLAGWSMLAGGGLGIPACTLAAGLLWGLVPASVGARFSGRSGWVVLAVLAGMVGLLGLVPQDGLIAWISIAMGGMDVSLHVLAGAMLTLTLAWLAGRRLWAGVAAGVLVGLAGGLAELIQGALSVRGAELRDWRMHVTGCLIAMLLYVAAWLWGWSWRRRAER